MGGGGGGGRCAALTPHVLGALAQVHVQAGNANEISAASFAQIHREAPKERSIDDERRGLWFAAEPAANPV